MRLPNLQTLHQIAFLRGSWGGRWKHCDNFISKRGVSGTLLVLLYFQQVLSRTRLCAQINLSNSTDIVRSIQGLFGLVPGTVKLINKYDIFEQMHTSPNTQYYVSVRAYELLYFFQESFE